METIESFVRMLSLMAFAFGCGLFADLYSFCLGDPHNEPVVKGRVLSRVGLWMAAGYHATQNRIESERTRRYNAELERAREAYYKANAPTLRPFNHAEFVATPYDRPNWWKAIGVCPRCFNVYFTVGMFVVLMLVGSGSPWWWLFVVPFLGLSNWALSLSAGSPGRD